MATITGPNATQPSAGRHRRSRLVLYLVLLAGVAIHLPSFWWGFFADDYGHQVILRGESGHFSLRPWNLYDFGSFPEEGDAVRELGVFPWWTSPDWKIRFFRPLSSLSLWLDYVVWGEWAVGYHFSGLVLYLILLVLTYHLYRAWALAPPAAVLALALFAAHSSSVFPVGWPAHRNSLIAVLLTVASVLVWMRWSQRSRSWALPAAWLLAAGAALAKESGVAAFALLAVAMAMGERRGGGADGEAEGDSAGGRKRAGGLAVITLVIGAAFPIGLALADYGATSVFYATPWSQTESFVLRVLVLLSVGLMSLLGLFSADTLLHRPESGIVSGPVCAAVLVLLGWVLWPRVRRHPAAVFFVLWAVLMILPQGGAPPADRLLFDASVGSAAVVAIFVDAVLMRKALPAGRAVRSLAWVLLAAGLVMQTLAQIGAGVLMATVSDRARAFVVSAEVGSPEIGPREVFVLNSPNALAPLQLISVWAVETEDREVRFWPMQFGRRGLEWTRVGERSFELESLGKPFLQGVMEDVFLTAGEPAEEGHVWRTALFEVEAVESGPEGLRRIRVTLPESLDMPGYRFLAFRDGRLKSLPPPAIGETVRVEPVSAPLRFIPG